MVADAPGRRPPRAAKKILPPRRYIVVRRTFDMDDSTYKYESPVEAIEVGYSYGEALGLAKDLAEKHEGGCFFVTKIEARAETIVSVKFEMKEYD